LKLLDRNEVDLENGIKIVKAISKDSMNFGLDVKGLDPRKHIRI